MAMSPEKALAKAQEEEGKKKKKALARELREKNKQLGAFSRLPPLANMIVSPGSGIGAAYLDGRLGGGDHQHTPSVAKLAIEVVAAGGLYWANQPTASAGAAALAAGTLTWLGSLPAFEAGKRAKADAAAAQKKPAAQG